MHSGDRWRLGHRPALDGLRGIAILLVLLAHLRVPYAGELGATGVSLFFTLSGFLITALLIEERAARGGFSIRRFYLRRAARLGPALALTVALALLAEWLIRGAVADWSLAIGAVTWSSNFVMADVGWQAWATTPLEHTWSLAIEEQFYLIWPLALLALTRLNRTVALTVIIWAAVVSALVQASVGFEHAYLLPDARAYQLLLGAALAFALTGRPTPRVPGRYAGSLALAIVGVGLVSTGRPTVGLVVTLLTVAALLAGSTTTRTGWLGSAPLTWIGERAYGLYLYHVPVIFIASDLLQGPWWTTGLPVLLATTVMAAASYRWVETPIRRRVRQETPATRSRNSALNPPLVPVPHEETANPT